MQFCYRRNFYAGNKNGKAVAVEVKRQRKEFKPDTFAAKVQHLKDKVLPGYEIDQVCLTLSDIPPYPLKILWFR